MVHIISKVVNGPECPVLSFALSFLLILICFLYELNVFCHHAQCLVAVPTSLCARTVSVYRYGHVVTDWFTAMTDLMRPTVGPVSLTGVTCFPLYKLRWHQLLMSLV